MATLKWAILLVSIPAVFSAHLVRDYSFITYYNDSCTYDYDCPSWMSHVSCQYVGWGDQRCLCDYGYLYKNDKCYAKKNLLGKACRPTSDVCTTEHSDCIGRKCQCVAGYHKYGIRCVLNDLGTECNTDKECQGIDNSRCYNGKCACNDFYFPQGRQCVAGLNATCLSGGDCKVENSACNYSTNKCECQWNHVAVADNKCMLKANYNGKCDYDVQCSETLAHTSCKYGGTDEKHCVCDDGYLFQKGKCYAEKSLGDKCDAASDVCLTANSDCLAGQCQCIEGYHEDGQKCALNEAKHNETCIGNEQCSASIAHTICKDAEPGNKRCECEDEYYFNSKECRRKKYAGEVCEVGDCYASNSACVDGKCKCNAGYKQDGNQCVLKKLEDDCTDDKECAYANSKCKNGKCSCKDDHFVQEGQCVAGSGLNATCQSSDECKTVNSECDQSEKICKCKPNHIVVIENNQCMPKAKYSQKCEYDVQCYETLAHTTCKPWNTKDRRCACEDGYYFNGKVCRQNKIVGEVCEVGDCTTPYSHCGDGRCKCNKGFSQVGERCEFRLGFECEEDSDCGSDIFMCRNNKCAYKE